MGACGIPRVVLACWLPACNLPDCRRLATEQGLLLRDGLQGPARPRRFTWPCATDANRQALRPWNSHGGCGTPERAVGVSRSWRRWPAGRRRHPVTSAGRRTALAALQGFDSYRAAAISTSGFAYSWGGGADCKLGTELPITQQEVRLAVIRKEAQDGGDDSLSDIDVDLGYARSIAATALPPQHARSRSCTPSQ